MLSTLKIIKKNIIILSPHPDDLELSTSLLCTKLKRKFNIIEIILTDGSMGGINRNILGSRKHIETRKNEAKKSGKILGINKIFFLGYPDSKLEKMIPTAKKEVYQIIKKYNPIILCFPSSNEKHKDHIATHFIGEYILKKENNILDLQYCFWGKNNVNNVKIKLKRSSYIKGMAIKQHQSQTIEKYTKNHKDILKKEVFYSERGFNL